MIDYSSSLKLLVTLIKMIRSLHTFEHPILHFKKRNLLLTL